MSDPKRYSFRERRRPVEPRSAAERRQVREEEERRRRREAFDKEEGGGEDLAQMMLKFGRRTIAHHAHMVHAFNDYRDEVRHRMLLRALGGNEERAAFVKDRAEWARTRSREYMRKAMALGLDQLATYLEVQRGYFDVWMDRWKNRHEVEDKLVRFVDRVVGFKEEDLQQATVKSIILYELVQEMVRDQDPLVQKLGPEERRKLFEFATGMRKEAPEFLAPLFHPEAGSPRPEGGRRRAGDAPVEVIELRLGPGVAPAEGHRHAPGTSPLWEREFTLQSDLFEEEELNFYIGPCVALPPKDWEGDWDLDWPGEEGKEKKNVMPWPDARTQVHDPMAQEGVIRPDPKWIVPKKGAGGGSSQAPELQEPHDLYRRWKEQEEAHLGFRLSILERDNVPAGDDREAIPRLPMLGHITGRVDVYWSRWLDVHRDFVMEFTKALGHKELPKVLRYCVDITLPTLRKVLRVTFEVNWPADA